MQEGCPYLGRPASAVWKKAVAALEPGSIAPQGSASFPIEAGTRIASAGSCFAQHLARYLPRWGCTSLLTEPGPAGLTDAERRRLGFGVFPARFGNIYSSLQLLQLMDRAYGRYRPVEPPWPDRGGLLDPFRPAIQPGPFPDLETLEADRERHFAAVREMFETLDVFIFTLGLTEAWVSAEDGAVFPVCPGCGGGVFDPGRHRFVNFRFGEVVGHLERFLDGLKAVNPGARTILTVSPVPLVATMEDRHVLTSTGASKAILRAVADELARSRAEVDYFPSYEIITGTFQAATYFAADRRNITEDGVDHVMRVFAASYLGLRPDEASGIPAFAPPVVCEEERAYGDDLADLEVVTRTGVEFYAQGRIHAFIPEAERPYGEWLRKTWKDQVVLHGVPQAWFEALAGAAKAGGMALCLGASQTMHANNWPRSFGERLREGGLENLVTVNLGMGGTTAVESLWTLQAFLSLLKAADVPPPCWVTAMLGCTDVMYRALRCYYHVTGYESVAIGFREQALLGPGQFPVEPAVLAIRQPERTDRELPLLTLPESWQANLLGRIEVSVQALETELRDQGLRGTLVLQPVKLLGAGDDWARRLEAAPGLDRRIAQGIVLHVGEYTALKAPAPPTPAMDLDPVFAGLRRSWARRPRLARGLIHLDWLDFPGPEKDLFDLDAVHYTGRGSLLLGRRLAETALDAGLLKPD